MKGKSRHKLPRKMQILLLLVWKRSLPGQEKSWQMQARLWNRHMPMLQRPKLH